MPDTTFNSSEQIILGKLLSLSNPTAARSMLDKYIQSADKPLDKNVHNLNFYFFRFCRMNGADAMEYMGQRLNPDRDYERKIFIASAFKIYKPQVFTYGIQAARDFAGKLAMILFCKRAINVMDEAIELMKNDSEFAARVNEMVSRLVEPSRKNR